MIGPGWMPSRPVPLGRMRRGLLSHTSSYLRRRPTRRRPVDTARPARDVTAHGCDTGIMLFDGSPAELPAARVLPNTPQAKHRMISGHVQQWLAHRWRWLRPRTVPMIVAFVGMLGVLGATKYLPALSYVDRPAPRVWRCLHQSPFADDQVDSPGAAQVAPPQHGRGTAPTIAP
jgi:hypothetical protein